MAASLSLLEEGGTAENVSPMKWGKRDLVLAAAAVSFLNVPMV